MSKWKRLRVHERYKAQALVIQFVKDVTGLGETVRKVYEFRKKVIRVQRWIKDFFWLKHVKLQKYSCIFFPPYSERFECRRD